MFTLPPRSLSAARSPSNNKLLLLSCLAPSVYPKLGQCVRCAGAVDDFSTHIRPGLGFASCRPHPCATPASNSLGHSYAQRQMGYFLVVASATCRMPRPRPRPRQRPYRRHRRQSVWGLLRVRTYEQRSNACSVSISLK